MDNILKKFRLDGDKEDLQEVVENVDRDVVFKGTTLWILVFAIFIASLGLNVNSTAVVIGAMLVSPLMGPIIGLGFGMAINDLHLLRKAASNYLGAAAVGLVTSTIFFSLSPLNDASSEILSRTAPNIYDVLIALFGGFAGILAVVSRNKGNVIPGVAIATALMPPLCTAGYGLANWNFTFFFGALYLFLINTVFIALATLVTARFIKFPYKHLPEPRDEVFARRIVWIVVLVTILPSIYFGYDTIKQNQFRRRADRFVRNEANFPNDYLLKKSIDAKSSEISLTFGGEAINNSDIEALRGKLQNYDLAGAKLEIHQGFAYLKEDTGAKVDEQAQHLSDLLTEKESQIQTLQAQVNKITSSDTLAQQIFSELKVQYPQIDSVILQKAKARTIAEPTETWVAIIESNKRIEDKQRKQIAEWLKVRINTETINLYFN